MSEPRCERCGRGSALYVCRGCGGRVCGYCLDPTSWLCTNCTSKKEDLPSTQPPILLKTLILIGLIILIVGVALLTISTITQAGSISSVGVVIVGPIPILIGSGPDIMILAPIAVILTVIAITLFLLFQKSPR